MKIKLLKKTDYPKWVERLIGHQPTYGIVFDGKRWQYNLLTSVGQLTENYILPDLSVKSFVFPSVEKVFSFSEKKGQITIQDISLNDIQKKILFGVRPCDTMGIHNLSFFFKEGKTDTIVQTKIEKTTVISYACNQADENCFCTSVGGNPGSIQGSDMLLTKTDTGDFLVEILTKKGEEILSIAPEYFKESTRKNEKENYLAHVPVRFEISALENKMKAIFESSIFEQSALKCIGCQVCAFVCPTCSCFDIQDEKKGSQGHRLRCWDGCGSRLFTLHASGHNPRSTQGMRWRQRLMHKFSYLPKKMKRVGCVGCGRCSRHCPVGMNLIEELTSILNV